MRVLGWISAIAIVGVLTVGWMSAHRGGNTSHALTAAHQQGANVVGLGAPDDRRSDPPHVVGFPSPSPSPVTQPPKSPTGGGVPPARKAPPPVTVGSTQQALINADRRSRGLAPLSWSSCLYNVAVANARRIAAQGYLSHTNGPQTDLGCRLGNRAGENIGYWSQGINDGQMNTMFMHSPDHYANITGPYHFVATAWVVAANGSGYIAVEFS